LTLLQPLRPERVVDAVSALSDGEDAWYVHCGTLLTGEVIRSESEVLCIVPEATPSGIPALGRARILIGSRVVYIITLAGIDLLKRLVFSFPGDRILFIVR